MTKHIKRFWRRLSRLRITDAERARYLRGECLGVAQRYETQRVDGLVRAAQTIFDWMERGALPPEGE